MVKERIQIILIQALVVVAIMAVILELIGIKVMVQMVVHMAVEDLDMLIRFSLR